MAFVRNIDVEWQAKGSAHPTHVDARIKVISTFGNDPLVQIDTFGSDSRKIEGKTSQTLQLDRRAAEDLVRILSKAYNL